MNIFVTGFQHETNTFAPSLADWAAFTSGATFLSYQRGGNLARVTGKNLPLGGFADAAIAAGHKLRDSVYCGATPSAHVTRDAYERIASEVVEDAVLNRNWLQAVYLDLHGAAVAQHVDDCEGELLQRLRAALGSDVPIIVSLDLHANVSERMLSLADGLVSYRKYPHTDMADTGRLAFDLLERRMALGSRQHVCFKRLPYLIALNAQSTWMQPAKAIYESIETVDETYGAMLSFCPGFPAADVPDCAPMLWAHADTQQAAEAALGKLLALVDLPQQWAFSFLDADAAVGRALALAEGLRTPVVIADTQDNPGAGGDSNTTGMLHALLRCGAGTRYPRQVGVGLMFDPAAAQAAHAAVAVHGLGCTLRTVLGKAVPTFTGEFSDAPLSAAFTVLAVHEGRVTLNGPMFTAADVELGPCALLEVEGVWVAVVSRKKQLLDRGLLQFLGVEPSAMKIMVVKSSNHFRADFTPLVADAARDIIVAKARGPMAADPADLPWKNLSPDVRTTP